MKIQILKIDRGIFYKTHHFEIITGRGEDNMTEVFKEELKLNYKNQVERRNGLHFYLRVYTTTIINKT